MAERTTSSFRRLFEVRLLHHYWLDEGATIFDAIGDPAKKAARLLTYDRRPFLDVRPTPGTARRLDADRCVYRDTALGFVVGAPASAVFSADTVLSFVVSVKSARFYEYTSLTLRRPKIHELFKAGDERTYRYKENVPVLSNLTGVTRTAGATTILFLSKEIPAPAASDQVESLVRTGAALLQLTSDNPGATTQPLGAQASSMPVFMHQDEAPALVAPPGLSGVPAKGVQLSDEIDDEVFAVIELAAVRADDGAFSFVDAGGAPKASPPVYEVRFKNRSTRWSYLDKRTKAPISATSNPLPLTFFGNPGSKQKPDNGLVKAEMAGTKITRLISEIYV